MRPLIVTVSILICIALPIFAQETAAKPATHQFDKAEYLPEASTVKEHVQPVKGTLEFDSEKKLVVFVDHSRQPVLSIPYDSIKSETYEKANKTRYAEAILVSPLFLSSPAKKHYLTFQYTDTAGVDKYAIIHLDKSNAMQATACAEAQTGKKVEKIFDEK